MDQQNNLSDQGNQISQSGDKKTEVEKLKEKIKKIEERNKSREENLNHPCKKNEIDFEKARFEVIQKSSKQFNRITEQTKEQLMTDLNKFDFSKVLEEIIQTLFETKFDLKDLYPTISIISELHQIYDDKFTNKFLETLKKNIEESNKEIIKQSKTDEETEKKINKRKFLIRMFFELYLNGIISESQSMIKMFKSILKTIKDDEQIGISLEFPLLVYIMKTLSLPLFGYKSKQIQKLIQSGEIEDFEIVTPQSKKINDNFYNSFKDFYAKIILSNLDKKHTALDELEKKNEENIKAADSQSNITYQKERASYLKFINTIGEFAEIMNFEVPELVNEKTLRYGVVNKGTEKKFEKINKYDPFSDEAEYNFYTVLLSITEESKNKINNTSYQGNFKGFENLMNKTSKCDNKASIDEITYDYLRFNYLVANRFRSSFVQKLIQNANGSTEILKYYARLIANLNQVYTQLSFDVSNYLYDNLMYSSDIEDEILYSRFIAELVKFGVFPNEKIFSLFKSLTEKFQGDNIDIACNLLDNCGRYLYLNEDTNSKFSNYIDTIKQLGKQMSHFDNRMYNIIMNSIAICRPQEKTLRKKVKIRPIEEEYVRFLFHQILNKTTINKVTVLLRKMNWDKTGEIIFKVIFKYLIHSNEDQIDICCQVISLLKPYHPELIHNLLSIFMEQIRIGLERNDFNDNQHKILLSFVMAYFYMHDIIDIKTLYQVLYMIILFNPGWSNGQRELIADNPMDSSMDTFRLLMITTILEVCGVRLGKKALKPQLDEFIQFFQIYILTKQYLPLDIENKITSCLEHLGNYDVYNDFHSALKDSKNYTGLNFEIFEEENESKKDKEALKNKKEGETKETKEQCENGSNINPDDDSDFKRNDSKKDLYKDFDIDSEIEKLQNEFLNQNKGSTSLGAVINPLADLKKKDLTKVEPGKFRLITKKNKQIIIKEVSKKVEVKKEEKEDYEDDRSSYSSS